MRTPVRWGILGTAGINEAMAPAITQSPFATLAAIASRTQEKAEAGALAFGAERAITGYASLLADPAIEAVYIPLPNALHAEWTLKALAAGKHVLCEKPLAVTEQDARSMIAAASDNGVMLAEAFMYAHHPRYSSVREIIANGEIGDIRVIITSFSFNASDELDHSGFQGMPGSGAIYDVGCYAVHSARLLLQCEPIAVTARGTISELHGVVDLTTSALVEFDSASLLFHVGMAGADTDTIEIIGSTGRIVIPHAFICGENDGDFFVTRDDETRLVVTARHNHYVDQVNAFSQAVRSGKWSAFPTEDAVSGARVLEALTLSVQQNIRVTV
jgi:xylose dehydrogenase (NAD/NADP)